MWTTINGSTADSLKTGRDRFDVRGFLTEGASQDRKPLVPHSAGKKPIMPNAGETAGQNMEKESPKKLRPSQSHGLFSSRPIWITDREGDLPIIHPQDARVGYGGTVGVAAEVGNHLLRTAERPLGVDDPVLRVEGFDLGGEGCGSELSEMTSQVTCTLEPFQSGEKLGPKNV